MEIVLFIVPVGEGLQERFSFWGSRQLFGQLTDLRGADPDDPLRVYGGHQLAVEGAIAEILQGKELGLYGRETIHERRTPFQLGMDRDAVLGYGLDLEKIENTLERNRSRVFLLAEKEGFEPSRRSTRPTPLAGEPLRPLGYFSKSELFGFV